MNTIQTNLIGKRVIINISHPGVNPPKDEKLIGTIVGIYPNAQPNQFGNSTVTFMVALEPTNVIDFIVQPHPYKSISII